MNFQFKISGANEFTLHNLVKKTTPWKKQAMISTSHPPI